MSKAPAPQTAEEPAGEVEVLPPAKKRRRRKRQALSYLDRDGSKPLPLQFDEATRLRVRDMASWGVPQEDIARHVINPHTNLPINPMTLRANFRSELDEGMSAGNVALSKSLFGQAVGMPAEFGVLKDEDGNIVKGADGEPVQVLKRSEMKPSPGPAIFLAKNRLGMSDQAKIEPPKTDTETLNALAHLSSEDLIRLRSILRKRLSGPGESAGDHQGDRQAPKRKKA